TTFLGGLVQLSRECRRSGGVVDVDGAMPHAGKCAGGSKSNRPQVIIITNTGKDKISAFGCGLRRWCEFTAVIGGPFFCFRSRAIEDCEWVTSPFCQRPGHRITHNAKTNERYVSNS